MLSDFCHTMAKDPLNPPSTEVPMCICISNYHNKWGWEWEVGSRDTAGSGK